MITADAKLRELFTAQELPSSDNAIARQLMEAALVLKIVRDYVQISEPDEPAVIENLLRAQVCCEVLRDRVTP